MTVEASFPASGLGVLDDRALECRAVDPALAEQVTVDRATSESAPITRALDSLLIRGSRALALDEKLRIATVESVIELAKIGWESKGETFDQQLTAIRTTFGSPVMFGEAFAKGFFGLWLEDLLNAVKFAYEGVLLVGALDRCLGAYTFAPGAAAAFDVSVYLGITEALDEHQACERLKELAREIDAVVEKVLAFFDPEDATLTLYERAFDIFIGSQELALDLIRTIPPLTEGPYREWFANVVKDPVQLGRTFGQMAAMVVGAVYGIEEVVVLATGVRALGPLIIAGGVLGGLTEDSDTSEPEPVRKPARRIAANSAKETLEAFTKHVAALGLENPPTLHEYSMLKWFISAFEQARAMRRLEEAEYSVRASKAALEKATRRELREHAPELLRQGTRMVDAPSLEAARDVGRAHKDLHKSMVKLRELLSRQMSAFRFIQGSYAGLSQKLRKVNEQMERIFYLTVAQDLPASSRIDGEALELLTRQLHGNLFEAAHIVDARFIDPERAQWQSVQDFLARMPAWNTNGVGNPKKMPAIALLATEHRVYPASLLNELGWEGMLQLTPDRLTSVMNGMITFEGAQDMAKVAKQGGFIVTEATSAADVVEAQRRIYERYFPELSTHLEEEIQKIAEQLGPASTLTWTPP